MNSDTNSTVIIRDNSNHFHVTEDILAEVNGGIGGHIGLARIGGASFLIENNVDQIMFNITLNGGNFAYQSLSLLVQAKKTGTFLSKEDQSMFVGFDVG